MAGPREAKTIRIVAAARNFRMELIAKRGEVSDATFARADAFAEHVQSLMSDYVSGKWRSPSPSGGEP
jgi:hypothetical protein